MRLENFGTATIYFGYEFDLEILTEGEWLPSSAEPVGWPSVGLGVGGGRTERCQRFRLPADLMPGRYRITKRFTTKPAGHHEVAAAAQFDVVP
jgi:hypothetical protein